MKHYSFPCGEWDKVAHGSDAQPTHGSSKAAGKQVRALPKAKLPIKLAKPTTFP